MSDILCVTSRALCREDFLTRVQALAKARPAGVILREKDLSPEEYRVLAAEVMRACSAFQVPCILHTFADAAMALGADRLHMPLPLLRQMRSGERARFSVLGASCHSARDAVEAERLGCTYITAGHVFETDCKQGLPGRGLAFLREVCESVSIPVYAIGGIGPENIGAVRRSGAAGACVMSGAMACTDPEAFLALFRSDSENYG